MNFWSSPLMRWHVRHVLLLWIGTRLLVSMALAWTSMQTKGAPPVSLADMLLGPGAGLISLAVMVALVAVDRRRIWAPLYFANLGYSWRWQLATAAAIGVIAEAICVPMVRLLLVYAA